MHKWNMSSSLFSLPIKRLKIFRTITHIIYKEITLKYCVNLSQQAFCTWKLYLNQIIVCRQTLATGVFHTFVYSISLVFLLLKNRCNSWACSFDDAFLVEEFKSANSFSTCKVQFEMLVFNKRCEAKWAQFRLCAYTSFFFQIHKYELWAL